VIAAAKEKAGARPRKLEGTPRFDDLPTAPEDSPPSGFTPKETLSPNTAAGLEALAKATAAHQEQVDKVAIEEEAPVEELTEEQKLKKTVEARCSELDIGRYLMSGELTQTVGIIPEKLIVVFRSVTGLEEVYVDAQLAAANEDTGRQFIRRTSEFALAAHIVQLNGVKWPAVFDGDGTVSEKAMELRVANVRKLPTPIFNLLVQNLQWFMDRISNSLTLEALGNG
jgi:hypothetical protein